MSESHTCLRSEEFGKLHADVNNLKDDVGILKKAVMEGNGEPALTVTVPQLSIAVKDLTPQVEGLKTGVSSFLQFQKEQEGYHKGKQTVRNRDRWLIGIMVTVILGLLIALFSMRSANHTHQKTIDSLEQTR